MKFKHAGSYGSVLSWSISLQGSRASIRVSKSSCGYCTLNRAYSYPHSADVPVYLPGRSV